jgi:hypothetical protein
MELDILTVLKNNVYLLLEKYVKENRTGLVNIYLIMNYETRDLLCGETIKLFLGVKTAIDDTLDFGKVIIR